MGIDSSPFIIIFITTNSKTFDTIDNQVKKKKVKPLC